MFFKDICQKHDNNKQQKHQGQKPKKTTATTGVSGWRSFGQDMGTCALGSPPSWHPNGNYAMIKVAGLSPKTASWLVGELVGWVGFLGGKKQSNKDTNMEILWFKEKIRWHRSGAKNTSQAPTFTSNQLLVDLSGKRFVKINGPFLTTNFQQKKSTFFHGIREDFWRTNDWNCWEENT